jgi:hypothetical protein
MRASDAGKASKDAPKPRRQSLAKAQKADAQQAKPQKTRPQKAAGTAPRKAKSDGAGAARAVRAPAKNKQNPPPKPPPVERLQAEGERLIAALQRHPAPWATCRQLGLDERGTAAVVKQLVAAKRIVSVGKLDQSEAYALTRGEDAATCLESLAARTLADLARPGKLDLLPFSEKDARYRGIPAGVRSAIVALLTRRVSQRDAFPVQVGKASFVVLAESVRALVGVEPPRGAGVDASSSRRAQTSLDRHSVVRAYQQLSRKRRSPNIIVSELHRESGVELTALQGWLLGECMAHRAVPLLGEPAHATPEQLAAALVVEGRPHLYVRLVQEQPS